MSGGTVFLIWILLLVGGFWYLVIRPQRALRARAASMQSELGPGDEVLTVGGLYGTITAVEGDVVYIEVAPDVELRIAKGAIGSRVEPAEDEDEDDELDEVDEVDEVDDEEVVGEADELADEVDDDEVVTEGVTRSTEPDRP
jgi:preprotein translocase subunit YajC